MINTLPGAGFPSVTMKLQAGFVALLPGLITGLTVSDCMSGEGSLYDHQLTALDNSRNISMTEFSGKVVLLVNVATY